MNYKETPKFNGDRKRETKGLTPFITAAYSAIFAFISFGFLFEHFSIPTGAGGMLYPLFFPPFIFVGALVYGVMLQALVRRLWLPVYVRTILMLVIPMIASLIIMLICSPMDGGGGNALYYVISKVFGRN